MYSSRYHARPNRHTCILRLKMIRHSPSIGEHCRGIYKDCLQVADFLDADLSLWAVLISAFLFDREMSNHPHPGSTVVKLPKLQTPAQLLAAIPRVAYPVVLSTAEHINLAAKLALCPTDLHSSCDNHFSQEAIIKACLESHADSRRNGITVSTADLVKHGSVIAGVPDLLSLHVRFDKQDLSADEVDMELCEGPAHALAKITNITSLSLTGHATPTNGAGLPCACQELLASCAHLRRLRSLKITRCGWRAHTGVQGSNKLGPQTLMDALESLKQLEEIDLSHCNINMDSLPYLCSGLSNLSGLTRLNLSHNCLSPDDAAVERSVIELPEFWQTVKLQHLDLGHAGLKTCGSNTLQSLVNHQSSLTSLDLAGNPRLVGRLCTLAEPTRLRSLNLAGTLIEPQQLTDFAQRVLERLPGLTRLSLRGSGGGMSGMLAMRNRFWLLSHLQELDLSGTKLRDMDVAVLVPHLTRLTSLRTLRLEVGTLGKGGAQQLAQLPACAQGLQRLHLEAEAIPVEVAGEMGARLAGMTGLTQLAMNTMFTGDAAGRAWRALAEQMPGNVRLTGVELRGCWIGAVGATELMRRLALMTSLRELAISQVRARAGGGGGVRPCDVPQRWQLGPDGAAGFASAVAAMPRLVRLEAAGCRFGDAGVSLVARRLGEVPQLTHLDLGCNSMGASGLEVLAEHIPLLRHLRTLDVSERYGMEQAAVSALSAAVAGMPAMVSIAVGQRESVRAMARIHGPGLLRCLV